MLLNYIFDNIFVMDNLYRLRIFAHICKTLNFTESARQLHLAQPAISRHIKSLEDELGRTLFLRQKRKVQLTQEGRSLLLQIDPLLSEFDRIFNDFILEKTTVAGILRIGSIFEAGTYLYMDHLIRFQSSFPQIEIRIEFGSSDRLFQKISMGEIDFALVSRLQNDSSIASFTLFRDHPVLVGNSTKKKIDSENKIPLISYREEDYYTDEFLKRKWSSAQRKNIQYLGSVSSHEAMLYWALKSNAYCIVPHSSYLRSRYRNELKIFDEDSKESSLNLIYLKTTMTELRKKIFLQNMQDFLNHNQVS